MDGWALDYEIISNMIPAAIINSSEVPPRILDHLPLVYSPIIFLLLLTNKITKMIRGAVNPYIMAVTTSALTGDTPVKFIDMAIRIDRIMIK